MKKLLILSTSLFLLACTSTTPQDTVNDTTEPTVDTSGVTMLSGTHTVVLETSKGDITLELYADKSPKTVTNFVTHAKNGYYDNLVFHRVIKDFMIQGGDPLGNGTGGESIYGEEFEDEINDMPMVKGMIAMANRGPSTNGSQFFIMHGAEAPWLVGKHTVFGKVTEGMDVLDAIANSEVGPGDRPSEDITFSAKAL
jgi:peptidyl-prolyl cis-trans isomerase B (cyclophilin B)